MESGETTSAVDAGLRHQAAARFAESFGERPAVVVADENTFRAAGGDVQSSLLRARHPRTLPIVLGPDLHAEYGFYERLLEMLARVPAVPIAVGSGTINDLVKLAAHRLGRPYMAVATAASMDGYAAWGASITRQGSKQTFECAAPRVVLADLDVIAAAPAGMNSSGYADLLAKIAAGADWILAEEAGVEPIHARAWEMVQGPLRSAVSEPAGVLGNQPECLCRLIAGLLASGFAMQSCGSSRPASGADHQFSHLWDMQYRTCAGSAPSHGFKVGIGMLASLALYEEMLRLRREDLDVEGAVRRWPSLEACRERARGLFDSEDLARVAVEEVSAKYIPPEGLREQLARLRERWPAVQERLRAQLLTHRDARDMLQAAGCPCESEQIGISRERLRRSFFQAYSIRRRYTVLDFAERFGVLDAALDRLFGVSTTAEVL